MNRKVNIYKYNNITDKHTIKKEYVCDGIFHQFGCDFEEFESGPGNFSTAIVELVNGEVKNVDAELIVFTEPPKEDN